jgi:hypothetical protein
MGLDFLSRKVLFSVSVVFNNIGTITVTVSFFCTGRRSEYSLEGLMKLRFLWSYSSMMHLNQKGTFEETHLEII